MLMVIRSSYVTMKPLTYVLYKFATIFGYQPKKYHCCEDVLTAQGYAVGKKIGEGAYGNVRIAKQFGVGENARKIRIVAVKIVNRNKLSTEFKDNFFHRELEILRKLCHPNVIRVYNIIDVQDKVYIVMKYARKGDLCNYIHDYGPLQEEKATHWFQQIVFGLSYCHDQGIAHRDLKSDNILIMNSRHVVISDFGLACYCRNSNISSNFSETYCGSPAYAAPEIISCQPYDPTAVDIWSLGIVFYFMLNASLPFDDSNLLLMLERQQKREFIFNPNLKLEHHCKRLILQMLDPQPLTRITLDKISQLEWLIQRSIVYVHDFRYVKCQND